MGRTESQDEDGQSKARLTSTAHSSQAKLLWPVIFQACLFMQSTRCAGRRSGWSLLHPQNYWARGLEQHENLWFFCLTNALGVSNDQVSLENSSLNHNSATPSYRHGGWTCLTSTSIWLPAVSVEMTNPIKARMRWAGGCSLLCMWAPQRFQSQYSGANGTAGTGVQGPGLQLWSPSMLPPELG